MNKLNESFRELWNKIKTDPNPALLFNPIYFLWVRLDRILDGENNEELRETMSFALIYLLMITGKYTKKTLSNQELEQEIKKYKDFQKWENTLKKGDELNNEE